MIGGLTLAISMSFSVSGIKVDCVSTTVIYLDGCNPKPRDVLRVPFVDTGEQGDFFFDCELDYQFFDNG